MKDSRTREQAENPPSLEVLLASIYYLMTRYARSPDPGVSRAIAGHLDKLASHAEGESEVLHKAGKRLAAQWREYLAGDGGEPWSGRGPDYRGPANTLH